MLVAAVRLPVLSCRSHHSFSHRIVFIITIVIVSIITTMWRVAGRREERALSTAVNGTLKILLHPLTMHLRFLFKLSLNDLHLPYIAHS